MSKTNLMKIIRDEIFEGTHLPLYAERIKNKVYPVIGEGSHDAQIMFVGEAPGKTEAETGRPFCGASGKVLDELLASISLPRSSVYITNIVKDRPPMNRDPHPNEIQAYAPYLIRQIEIIKPKVIAALGRYSMSYVMQLIGLEDKIEPISKTHGRIFSASSAHGEIKFIPLYHPAVAVYNRQTLETLKADFQTLRSLI